MKNEWTHQRSISVELAYPINRRFAPNLALMSSILGDAHLRGSDLGGRLILTDQVEVARSARAIMPSRIGSPVTTSIYYPTMPDRVILVDPTEVSLDASRRHEAYRVGFEAHLRQGFSRLILDDLKSLEDLANFPARILALARVACSAEPLIL